MLIDVHAHMITPGMLDAHDYWGPFMTANGFRVGNFCLGTSKRQAISDAVSTQKLLDKMSHDSRRALMHERNMDKIVLSIPSNSFLYWAGEFGNEYAEICNKELSQYCAEDPSHFAFWAHANLADPKSAIDQIDRAVNYLGAKGVCVGGSNFNGLEAHNEALFPVWEKLSELDVPLMVHGYNKSVWNQEENKKDLFNTSSVLGDCYDQSLFFWNLICGGALDEYPNLKTYLTNAGGVCLFQLGRLDSLNQSMESDAKNKKSVSQYLKQFWFDLDVHTLSLRKAVVEIAGVENILHLSLIHI